MQHPKDAETPAAGWQSRVLTATEGLPHRQPRVVAIALLCLAIGTAYLAGTYGWRHGALGLAILNAVTLLLAGHPWSITWAFSLWGAKLVQAVGYDLSRVPFWTGTFQQQALARAVLADSVSVMDFGVVLGACLAAGLASRFAPTLRIPLRQAIIALCGGLLLGYGARIAFGCNIGAYFSGIASTSLHGWLWLVGALLGTPIGVRLRTWLRVV